MRELPSLPCPAVALAYKRFPGMDFEQPHVLAAVLFLFQPRAPHDDARGRPNVLFLERKDAYARA